MRTLWSQRPADPRYFKATGQVSSSRQHSEATEQLHLHCQKTIYPPGKCQKVTYKFSWCLVRGNRHFLCGFAEGGIIDSGLAGSSDREEYHESRRWSRHTYPKSYITKSTSIRRIKESGGTGGIAAASHSFRTRGSELGPRSQTTIDLGSLSRSEGLSHTGGSLSL